jgi:hypothetical protein
MTALETRAPRNVLTHLLCEREEEVIEVRSDGLTTAFLSSSIRSRQTCFIRACEYDHCEPFLLRARSGQHLGGHPDYM